MAASHRAPKQWSLTKTETVTSFESWKQNLQYTLALDPHFARYLGNDVTWLKETRATPLRGFTNDNNTVPEANRLTAEQKAHYLGLMLGQVANYCPVIARSTIVRNSTSMDSIWQAVRMHYGFQNSGAHFLDLAYIKREPDERPEDLYQRIMAFVDDNLLTRAGNITHHNAAIPEDEELTPSLENFVVLTWLRLLHEDLPKLVKQRYGTELRCRTLASIKPEISQALDSLMEEIQSSQESRIMRSMTTPSYSKRQGFSARPSQKRTINATCPICKQAGRPKFDHYLSKCTYLPEHDRKFLTRARAIAIVDTVTDNSDSEDKDNEYDVEDIMPPSTRRVQTKSSPYIDLYYGHRPVRVTVDSGAESNMIRFAVAKHIGAPIFKNTQSATQADGRSQLDVVGETRITLSRDDHELFLDALVVETLDVDVLGGCPFMFHNDVGTRPKRYEVTIGNNAVYKYGPKEKDSNLSVVRRTQAHVLRADRSTTVWPGEYIEVKIPDELDEVVALEPRTDSQVNQTDHKDIWPVPDIVSSVGGKVRIGNTTQQPIVVPRHEHFCQVRSVFTPVSTPELIPRELPISKNAAGQYHSDSIKLDPGTILSPTVSCKFRQLHRKLDEVFNPHFKGYNGAEGPFEAIVNMGPVQPPQRKGRLPQYSRNRLTELQEKFDDLQDVGVFGRPEDEGIVVEYVNPSFLVTKPNGGTRLVTAFADVGRYSKPQPSLMPDVDSTLRNIARWKFIIATDLTSAFFQIPLSKESMKYCGVVTPFRGVRVYRRCAMGMPGSETALEELMCRVLGDLLQEGCVAKIADDLYVGGDSDEELLFNWERVLVAMHKNGLCLSAPKTIIAPKRCVILGWIWSMGTISASPHRVSSLAKCDRPEKVKGLRSYIGAYKVLARVIPNTACVIAPLEDAISGLQSHDKVPWSDELCDWFNQSQSHLESNKSVVLPRPDDLLWIVTDAAEKSHGLGATLYVTREGRPQVAGYFSAKLRKRQDTWIPCELEALAISTSVKHFSPYLIQSKHQACVLTDSKPCVQAYEKLCRGEFSASPRVTTFLTVVSRYHVSIRHLPGVVNLPSDFASRNAPLCVVPECQICAFVAESEHATVLNVSVNDVVEGSTRLPFTNRLTWRNIQSECSDLRRVHSHLKQGTRPSKRLTNIKDVKRYLNVASIASDGLLVVRKEEALKSVRELILVPRTVLPGLLTAIHLKLSHPTCNQLKIISKRYFYALDMDREVENVTKSCHHCAAIQKLPHNLVEQSSEDPPESVGHLFAADVLRREKQKIFVLRECVTSYTKTCIIGDEQSHTLRDAVMRTCLELRPLDGPLAVVRVDPAPGFQSLAKDDGLKQHRISIEIGRVKNVNKNPVAERAVQELEEELVRLDPDGGAISATTLCIATATLNSRIRSRGLSAREMFFQRDQFSNDQLPITDSELIHDQNKNRSDNHHPSAVSKSHKKCIMTPDIAVGDLVYIHSDRNKSKARSRYLVSSINGEWCIIHKFIGNQLRSNAYKVKMSECYKVRCDSQVNDSLRSYKVESKYDDEEPDMVPVLVPSPVPAYEKPAVPALVPPVPSQISEPINVTQEPMPECERGHILSYTDHGRSAPEVVAESSMLNSNGDSDLSSDDDIPDSNLPTPRRSDRPRRCPSRLDDYVLY